MFAGVEGVKEAFDEGLELAALFVTVGMAEATTGLKLDMRDQTVKAGLGVKMGNTWRAKSFPTRGHSLEASGYVWTKAPGAMDAFDRNPTIVPVNGRRMLAIPSPNVPRGGRYNRRFTPEQVAKAYGQRLTLIPGKDGTIQMFIKVVEAPAYKRGFTTSKVALKRAGRKAKMILMFTLKSSVRVGKRIDIPTAAKHWGDRAADLINVKF